MPFIDRYTIDLFHKERAEEFGPASVGALGWLNANSQQKRFEVLSGIADLNNSSVMDAGCGHGDLYAFLVKKYQGISYTGIEQNPAFLDIALERHHNPDVKFLLGDFTAAGLPLTDYVLCSGALNYRSTDPDFIQHAIENLFGNCRRGMGFNLLKEVKYPDSVVVAYNPADIMAICRQLTPQVQLHENYLPDDFSIFLYR